jgi:hypothetical protein
VLLEHISEIVSWIPKQVFIIRTLIIFWVSSINIRFIDILDFTFWFLIIYDFILRSRIYHNTFLLYFISSLVSKIGI